MVAFPGMGARMDKQLLPKGLRVLVVEDEALIALLLEDMIGELGADFVGPCFSLATALAAARLEDFDVALIDLNLGGERADEVAAILSERGIPFALATGSPDDSYRLGQTAVLQKPFGFAEVAGALQQLDAARA